MCLLLDCIRPLNRYLSSARRTRLGPGGSYVLHEHLHTGLVANGAQLCLWVRHRSFNQSVSIMVAGNNISSAIVQSSLVTERRPEVYSKAAASRSR